MYFRGDKSGQGWNHPIPTAFFFKYFFITFSECPQTDSAASFRCCRVCNVRKPRNDTAASFSSLPKMYMHQKSHPERKTPLERNVNHSKTRIRTRNLSPVPESLSNNTQVLCVTQKGPAPSDKRALALPRIHIA